jgi:hypothetical protein
MEKSQIWSTTCTVKCGWWTGRKILKLVKKYNALSAFRTGFNEVAFTVRKNDSKTDELLLLQNGPKEIHMTSGML